MFYLLKKYDDRENGFTLIELLIVVLIIGILAAIAIPVYLGIQNQAKNAATKADVNGTVHKIQVALTEGQALGTALTNNTDAANRSDGTKVVPTMAADNINYTVVGTQKDTAYTYTYDSVTGQFTDGSNSGNIALGGGGTPPVVLGALGSGAEDGEANNAAWFAGSSGTGGALPAAYFSTAQAKTGTKSVEVSLPANYTALTRSYKPAFVAGNTYKITASYYIPTGTPATINAWVYATSAGWSTTLINGGTVKGAWTTSTLTFTATSSTFVDFQLTGTGGNKSYIDDVIIQQQ